MLAAILIVFFCGISVFILFKDATEAISNSNLPKVVKVTLTIISAILICIGAFSMFIVLIAFNTGKGK